MKKLILVMTVVALLVVAAVSVGVANGAPGGQELRFETVNTDLSPGSTTTLPKAGIAAAAFDIYEEGDAFGTIIGQGKAMAMATEDVTVQGAIVIFAFEVTGKGEIHVSSGFGNSSAPGGRPGVILGGTGIYRGVTGEFLLERIAPGVLLATFKFNSGRN